MTVVPSGPLGMSAAKLVKLEYVLVCIADREVAGGDGSIHVVVAGEIYAGKMLAGGLESDGETKGIAVLLISRSGCQNDGRTAGVIGNSDAASVRGASVVGENDLSGHVYGNIRHRRADQKDVGDE